MAAAAGEALAAAHLPAVAIGDTDALERPARCLAMVMEDRFHAAFSTSIYVRTDSSRSFKTLVILVLETNL